MGIFDKEAALWNYYRVELEFRGRLNGGVPKDPAVIEGWLRAKAGIADTEEIRQAMVRTLRELGADVRPDMTYAEMVEASEALASEKSTNGFKRDGGGLYIEGRQVKAMIKEATNAYFAGDKDWGPTNKAPKSYVAERVFVWEDVVHLGRAEPDGVELSIGHITGPGGRHATITYYEYVERVRLVFHLMEARELRAPRAARKSGSELNGAEDKAVPKSAPKPSVTRAQWAVIWTASQELGLGARRSQEQGKFDIVVWERVDQPPARLEKVAPLA